MVFSKKNFRNEDQMRSRYRACICYLAGRLILGRDAAAIYDCSGGGHIDAAELLEENNISLLEARPPLKKHSASNGPAAICALYNSRSGEIYLDIASKTKNIFKAYASADCSLFMGKAGGNLVAVYDYREKSFFKYRLCSARKTILTCGPFCRDCGWEKLKSAKNGNL